jgi:hypothetical protein
MGKKAVKQPLNPYPLPLFRTNFFISESLKIRYKIEQKWEKKKDKLYSITKGGKRREDRREKGKRE